MADLTSRLLVVISASTGGAARELNELEAGARKSGAAFDTVGKQAGLAGATIRAGLAAGAAALVGTGLVAFLNDSVNAFEQAQAAAQQFSRATNATTEEAGKFTTVARAYGLEMNDLIEINAEFSKKVAQQPQLLRQLGVEVAKNADGSTNMTKTLVATIDALGATGDGLKAAQTAAQLFGEEGSKQLAAFYLAGIKVSDLMDRIDFVDSSEQAAKFRAATLELGLAFQQLQITAGGALVPALTTVADAGTALLDLFTSIPSQVYLAVGAFLALRKAAQMDLGVKAVELFLGSLDLLDARLVGTAGNLTTVRGAATLAGGALKSMAAASLPLLALGAVFSVGTEIARYAEALRDLSVDAEHAGGSLADLASHGVQTDSVMSTILNFGDAGYAQRRKIEDLTQSYRDQAEAVLQAATSTDAQRDAARRLLAESEGMTIQAKAANLATKDGEAARRDFIAATQGMAAAEADAAAKTNDLNDAVANFLGSASSATPQALADGLVSVAEAATAANEAALAQEQAANLAEVAMGQYAVSIQGVVAWQSTLAENTANTQSALGSLQDTLGQVGAIVDDPDTWENEVVLNTANATNDLWKYVGLLADSGLTSEKIIPLLVDLQNRDGTSADADALIAGVITAIQNKTSEMPVEVGTKLDPDSAEATKTGIDGLTVPKTVPLTVNADFAGEGGYSGLKARMDYLAQERSGSIGITTAIVPDGYNAVKDRADYLAQARRGLISIDTMFEPGGYLAVKSRIDAVSADRTATITVRVAGLDAARRAVQGVQGASATAFTRQQRIMLPSQAPVHPVNLVRVTLDGQQLRAIIRDESSRYSPARAEVA